jgi:hypothetical protein
VEVDKTAVDKVAHGFRNRKPLGNSLVRVETVEKRRQQSPSKPGSVLQQVVDDSLVGVDAFEDIII